MYLYAMSQLLMGVIILLFMPLLHSFNQEGRLVQVEYAQVAARNGGTVLAVKGIDSIVILSFSDALNHRLIGDEVSLREGRETPDKLRLIHSDLHIIGSGIASDVSHVTDYVFQRSMTHSANFGSSIPLRRLATTVGHMFHQRTLYPSSIRPLGCSVLLIGRDRRKENGIAPVILEVDTLGNVFDCDITCIGTDTIERSLLSNIIFCVKHTGKYSVEIASSWGTDYLPENMGKEDLIQWGKECMVRGLKKCVETEDGYSPQHPIEFLPSIDDITKGINAIVIDVEVSKEVAG